MPLIREALDAGGNVEIPIRGVSMLPMLKEGRDSVILSPIKRKLKKHDIVLYLRSDGSYVLHRIAIAADNYSCIGDAQFVLERGILYSQMIAVAVAFRRGRRLVKVTNPLYRLYCVIWKTSRPVRHFLRRAKRKICRMFGRKK